MPRTNIRGSQIADGADGVDLTVDVTGLLPILNGGTGANNAATARSNLGLGNVDNTSDATKNSATATLTNKTIVPRVTSISTGAATYTINCDTTDVYVINSQGQNITGWTITGTPVDNQKLRIVIYNSTATTWGITWTATYFEAGTYTMPLPTNMALNSRLDVDLIYNGVTGKWRTIELFGGVYRGGGTDVAVADGGTGRSTSTTAYGLIAAGTTATGAHQTISPGTSGQFLKSAGASALGAFAAIAESDVTNLVTDLAAKASLTGAETLTNKTLTSPKVQNGVFDTNGATIIGLNAVASAVNYVQVSNRATGVGMPTVQAVGTDTDIGLNLVSKNAGTVQANGVDVVTTTGSQTLTNKTLTSPTLTTPDLGTPSAAVLTNATGLVATTGLTATGTKDATTFLRGDNTWAAPAGGGGGGTWGSITGTLSSQTDLQTALDAKAPLASPTFTGTVSGITKSMVGLGSVDNTADTAKPVSTAQQTALDAKPRVLKYAAGWPDRPADSTPTIFTGETTTAPTDSDLAVGDLWFPAGPITSTDFRIADGTDTTKQLSFTLSGITTGQTRAITIPDASGTLTLGGYAPGGTDVPVTDGGTGASTAAAARTNLGVAALLTPTATKTANYTAVVSDLVICDNSAAGFTVTLPNAPTNGSMVGVKSNSAAFTVTVAAGGSDVFNQSGGSTTQNLTMQNQVSTFTYFSGVWYQTSQAIAVGQMDIRYVQPASTNTLTNKTMDLLSGGNTIQSLPWASEMVITSTGVTVADGYNDMPGGIMVEPGPNSNGINLDSIALRIGDLTGTNSGGDLVASVYGGTTTTQGTLITTVTLTNATNNTIAVLGSPYALAANAVVRVSLTKGSSTLNKALHVHLRGRYVG